MGGALFGKSNQTDSQPIASTLRVQTSIFGRPRPIGAGQNRYSGNMIWWGDFYTSKAPTPGGKGGAVGSVFGKGSGEYDYNVSAIIGLGEGPITSIDTIYNGNFINFYSTPSAAVLAALADLGITPTYGDNYPATFFLGTYPQTPWSYLTSGFPTQALPYPGEAYTGFTNLGLGSSPTFPNFSWEITWGINTSAGSTTKDVNPADWISAFLTNADWGVNGFSSALLGDLTAFSRFCQAYGLFMSPLLTDQSSAQSHLEDVMKACACDFKWSQGALTVGVYADLPNTANSATFTPSLTPVYALTDADYIKNQGSLGQAGSEDTAIVVARKNPSQAVNKVQLEYLDRNYLYNPNVISVADDAAIDTTGWEILSDLRSHHFFCYEPAAVQSCALQLGRERVLADYQFTLGAQFALLEIFDVVSVTVSALGFSGKLVRINEIQENPDQTLTFTAEDIPGTLGPVTYATQQPLGSAVNALADPGAINAPLIFEPPQTLATNSVWAAVSGVDEQFWGGCFVWVSTDGGATYANVGAIVAPARQGVTTATLPSVALNPSGQTIDNTNSLAVNLSESFASLASASSSDEMALVTLCYVGGELVAYETATLTSTSNYTLTGLVRGAYGSTIASHASGVQFARLDAAIYKYAYDAGQIGSTINIKFQGYNVYGGGAQDLSTLTAFTHTIAGPTSRTDTYSQTTTAGSSSTYTTQGFTSPFAVGPVGSPTPFVTITWTPTTGDSLSIISVTTSRVVYQILNAGAAVSRNVSITAQGY